MSTLWRATRGVFGGEFILSHHVGASLVTTSLAGDVGQEHCDNQELLGTLKGRKACCTCLNPSPIPSVSTEPAREAPWPVWGLVGHWALRWGPGTQLGSVSLCWMDDLKERMEFAWARIQGKGKKRTKGMKTLTVSTVHTSICSWRAQPVFKKLHIS